MSILIKNGRIITADAIKSLIYLLKVKRYAAIGKNLIM